MKEGISVIICCYNSEQRLPTTLAHLLRQKASGFDWEIIVVDNASTDFTSLVSKQILSEKLLADKFKIIFEKQAGLSNARRTGYLTSQYNYLLFCDDDNWLSENYLQLAYNTMQQNSHIGILGGNGEAVFEKTKPDWFDTYQINFAVGAQSNEQSEISKTETVYGAGFIVRKKIFQILDAIQFQSLLSDRKGGDLMSGGDTELCFLTRFMGYEIAYGSKLQFKHLMTDGRMQWNYLKKLYYGFGRMRVYTHAYKFIETTNELPAQNLRLPFWLDKYIHKLKELKYFLTQILFRTNKEGDDVVLKYYALRGEMKELRTLKGDYTKLFSKILAAKKQLAELKNAAKGN